MSNGVDERNPQGLFFRAKADPEGKNLRRLQNWKETGYAEF